MGQETTPQPEQGFPVKVQKVIEGYKNKCSELQNDNIVLQAIIDQITEELNEMRETVDGLAKDQASESDVSPENPELPTLPTLPDEQEEPKRPDDFKRKKA